MRITGHRTDKSFMRYVRLSKLDAAKSVDDHMKLNKSRYTLKWAV
jgi:hypothetical protein